MELKNKSIKNEIELTSDASKILASLETNKLLKVSIILQLIGYKKTVSTQQNPKNIQSFYIDQSKTIKSICLQIYDESSLNIGDVHLIKSIRAFNLQKSKIFCVSPNEFEVIGHMEIPKKYEEFIMMNRNNNVQLQKPSVQDQLSNLKYNPYDYLLSHLNTFSKDIKVLINISKKAQIKHFVSQKNKESGCLFNFRMKDVEGFEMDATAFGLVAENLNQLLIENHNYLIKGGTMKIADKRYSTSGSDYCIIFNNKTEIEEIKEDIHFNETQLHLWFIEDLPKLAVSKTIDCYVYVIQAEEKKTITTKKGDELSLRKLLVGDTSGYKCSLTLWKNHSDLQIEEKQILLLRYARIGDYNGRNLNSIEETVITINPSSDNAIKLHQTVSNITEWKSLENSNLIDYSLPTEIIYIKEVLDKAAVQDKGPIYKMKATICLCYHSQRNYYIGCPEKNCKKKLVNENNEYSCSNCNKVIEKPNCYYTLSLRIKDASTETYVNIFGETCTKLLGITAEEYKDLVDNNDTIKLNELSEKIEFKTKIFYGKGKVYIYNGKEIKSISIFRVEDLNIKEEARATLNYLKYLHIN